MKVVQRMEAFGHGTPGLQAAQPAVGTRTKVRPGGLAGWVLGLMDRRDASREARHMQVVETLSLGGRRQLMLIVCDGERFLVGASVDKVDAIVPAGAGRKQLEETWS